MRYVALITGCALALAAASAQAQRIEVPGFYPGETARWNAILSRRPAFTFEPGLAGIIVPHHMADQDYLAAVWHGVSRVRAPTLIVIFSPDHFTAGSKSATVPLDAVYPTPFGDVEVDGALAQALSNRGLARRSDAQFMQEHGIFAHTGFISKYFPGVRILPVILGWDTPRETLDGLAAALEELSPADTFFAASVDFSHYVPVDVSVFHDITSEKTILNMERDDYYHLEIDSPPSLYLMAGIMGDRGTARAVRFLHTQLQDYIPYPIQENTSHLYFAYYPGRPETVRAVSLMIFPESGSAFAPGGRIPGGLLDRWPPPKNQEGVPPYYPYLGVLRGTENRFLKGSDLYIFDMAPGIVVSRAVSGMRVSIVALAAGDQLQRVSALAAACDVLVLVESDPGAASRARWPDLAAAGADIIVGRGGGTAASWRLVGGALMIDSLGLWQEGGNSPVPSSVLGVIMDGSGCRVWEFPLSFERGVPSLRNAAVGADAPPKVPMSRE